MKSTTDIRLIYSTFPDMESARDAAAKLVTLRLVACVNMWPGMVSVYRWQGAVEEGAEVVVLAKTSAARLEEAMAAIVELHPFDEPAVLALDVAHGSPSFLDWIRAETRGGAVD
ncbi:divalent-cation tolerance protein CutA [Stappia sp.]|uniref:divalent-cation tolerance protein CutA n=1 Tax=Stappia sp. TaxID=1870903 RepID=UPI0032D9515B